MAAIHTPSVLRWALFRARHTMHGILFDLWYLENNRWGMHCTCRRGFQIGRCRNRGRVFSHRRTRRPSCIRDIRFCLCRFDKTRSGKRNKYLGCLQIARNHKRRIWPHLLSWLFHPIHIVGIGWRPCRFLFGQTPMGKFCTQCQTSPRRTRHISHCRLRTTIR